jgi:hypothetical protein
VRTAIASFVEFERAILKAPGAVWDVQLAKLMCVALGLVVAKTWPGTLALDVQWYLFAVLLFALRPAARAARLLFNGYMPLNGPMFRSDGPSE